MWAHTWICTNPYTTHMHKHMNHTTHMHIHMHAHICTMNIYTHMHTPHDTHPQIHANTYACTYTYACTMHYEHTYTHTHTICTHCTHMHAHYELRAHMHAHMYTHAHTCIRAFHTLFLLSARCALRPSYNRRKNETGLGGKAGKCGLLFSLLWVEGKERTISLRD